MFSPIDKKIKMIAEIVTKLGIVGNILGGVGLVLYGTAAKNLLVLVAGVIGALVGCLFFWTLGALLYAWGELIVQITTIARNTKDLRIHQESGSLQIDAMTEKKTTFANDTGDSVD